MKKILSLFALVPLFVFSQTAEAILQKAFAYHDPDGKWGSLDVELTFNETRPEGPNRKTVITLNNSESYMKINRSDEEIYEINGQKATVLLGEKTADRGILLRNYYLYLWGLPMKLLDESTPAIERVSDEKVGEQICFVLRVPYEKDTWYFYFAKSNGRLKQYKFYQDEGETKGELITLEGEFQLGAMKLPNNRSWYTLPDRKFLGTDILTSVK